MNTIEKVKELIKEMLPAGTEIDNETLLKDAGINSLSFIKLIVSLEDEFDIEFEDEELGKFETSSPATLTEYIEANK
ncbi:MAG: phosphopantetheine-binding protein [Roseburia sp.]